MIVRDATANLVGYKHDGTGAQSFSVDFKNGQVAAGGLSFNGLGGNGGVNTLREYEHSGLWTPELKGSTTEGVATYGSRGGLYTRIGDRIFWSARLTLTSFSGASGNLVIDGFPFVMRNLTQSNGGASIGFIAGLLNTTLRQVFCMHVANTSRVQFYKLDAGASGVAGLLASEVSGTFNVYLSGVFKPQE
ncbi:MAG: hypothetical protein LBJ15_04450 [Comamonas sp.]|jgi:hypothetical protein|uniref:hypothetical protein n=1 Tax=Comamonas sp. TaxID=34028 RepID=UPI0028171FCC|nr:hypothetical protein [Comamonas sp.]MDR0213238.1 hypothetical protein [Comamonas sp.]